jgi:hypothetical protein
MVAKSKRSSDFSAVGDRVVDRPELGFLGPMHRVPYRRLAMERSGRAGAVRDFCLGLGVPFPKILPLPTENPDGPKNRGILRRRVAVEPFSAFGIERKGIHPGALGDPPISALPPLTNPVLG